MSRPTPKDILAQADLVAKIAAKASNAYVEAVNAREREAEYPEWAMPTAHLCHLIEAFLKSRQDDWK